MLLKSVSVIAVLFLHVPMTANSEPATTGLLPQELGIVVQPANGCSSSIDQGAAAVVIVTWEPPPEATLNDTAGLYLYLINIEEVARLHTHSD